VWPKYIVAFCVEVCFTDGKKQKKNEKEKPTKNYIDDLRDTKEAAKVLLFVNHAMRQRNLKKLYLSKT
jgi:hypothetical protein